MESGLLNVRVFQAVSVRVTLKKKLRENIQDAIAACLQVRAERGFPLTIETQQVEVIA